MLNKAYPAPTPTLRNILVALAFGLFISFFLIFFEPFDIDLRSGRTRTSSLFIYGFITTLVLFLFLYVLPLLIPRWFTDSQWKVKHQMVFCFIILFVIATLNGLFTNFINELSFSWKNYWWIINRTFILGCIPFAFLILWDSDKKNRSYTREAGRIIALKKAKGVTQSSCSYTIKTDLKNESFTLNESQFSYAAAHGNYIDVFSEEIGELGFKTYRMNLASLEKQLFSPSLKRCHRSYLVNLTKIVNMTGNAQGIKLTLSGNQNAIPVSRKYIPEIKHFYAGSSSPDP